MPTCPVGIFTLEQYLYDQLSKRMKSVTAKEQILNRIKKALSHSTPMPFPEKQSMANHQVVQPKGEELTVLFAENFSAVQGQFIYCMDEAEMVAKLTGLQQHRQWPRIFCRESPLIDLLQQHDFRGLEFSPSAQAPVAITGCEKLIARTGSIMMSTRQTSGRTTSVYTPIHICIAYTSQLVYDIEEGLTYIQQSGQDMPSLITLATGPSRTADIEKTLVVGIHGPGEVYCFVVEDQI